MFHSLRLFLTLMLLCGVALAGQPNVPPSAPAQDEGPPLPTAKLEADIFAQSGELKIKYDEVERVVNLFLISQRKTNPKYVPSFDTLLKSRLNVAMIMLQNKAVEQYAEQNKLQTTPTELERFMDLRKKEITQNNSTYEQWLTNNGLKDVEYRKFLSAKIAIEKKAGESLTQKEKDDRYNELKDESPLRSVSHILYQYKGADSAPARMTRTKEEARKMAEEALAQLKAGKDFSELAKTSDDESSKGNGGSVEFFPLKGKDAMVEPFGKAAYALKEIGDLSPVVETIYGFHILKLTGNRDEELKKQIALRMLADKFGQLMTPVFNSTLDNVKFNEKYTQPPEEAPVAPKP